MPSILESLGLDPREYQMGKEKVRPGQPPLGLYPGISDGQGKVKARSSSFLEKGRKEEILGPVFHVVT